MLPFRRPSSLNGVHYCVVYAMSLDDVTAEALGTWKDHCFRPTDLPLADAVDSLVLEEPLIYARQSDTRKSDWVVSAAVVVLLLGPHTQMLTSIGVVDMSDRDYYACDIRVCGRVR